MHACVYLAVPEPPLHLQLNELPCLRHNPAAPPAAQLVSLKLSLVPLQVSATLLGEPDVGLLTPPEMSRKAGQVCMSVPTPVIVDADTGEPCNLQSLHRG